MSFDWNLFCGLNKPGDNFQNARIEKVTTLPREDIDALFSWCKNPSCSLFLHGDAGRGKTYLMHALMYQLIEKQRVDDIRWFKMKSLDDRILRELLELGSAIELLDTLCKVEFLFLDDFGIERGTERLERDVYEIIDRRNGWKKPTVVSSNLDHAGIERMYGQRILSRLKDYTWIHFDGKDLRGYSDIDNAQISHSYGHRIK